MGRIGEFTREAHEAAIGGNNLCLRGIGEPHPSEVKAKKELHARMMEKERVLAKLAADTAARSARRARGGARGDGAADAFAACATSAKKCSTTPRARRLALIPRRRGAPKYRAEISAMRKEDRAQRGGARRGGGGARRARRRPAPPPRGGASRARDRAPPAAPPLSPRERPDLCATRRATGGGVGYLIAPAGRWRDSPTRSSNAARPVAAGERAAAVGVPCRERARSGRRARRRRVRARRRARKAEKARLAALEGGIYDAAPPLVSPRGRAGSTTTSHTAAGRR